MRESCILQEGKEEAGGSKRLSKTERAEGDATAR